MSKLARNMLSGLTALILSGCTQIGIGVANLPAHFSNMEIYKNIAYGDEPWQKLDIYTPSKENNKKLPVVVFFYGGRWTDGSKDMYAFVGKAFSERGYVVVIADYSKYPDVKFPAFVEDGAKIVSWVYDHIEEYNGDTENLFVSGHSSGAHIGALVTVDPQYLKAEGKDRNIVSAFAGLAGPYDFVPDAADLEDMFGPPENYPKMRVTTYVDGKESPMLLLWGAKDKAVWERNLRLLKEKIEAEKGIVETKIYPDLNHVDIIAALTWFLEGRSSVTDDVDNFFNKYKTGDQK